MIESYLRVSGQCERLDGGKEYFTSVAFIPTRPVAVPFDSFSCELLAGKDAESMTLNDAREPSYKEGRHQGALLMWGGPATPLQTICTTRGPDSIVETLKAEK